jgi:hypothetical protein
MAKIYINYNIGKADDQLDEIKVIVSIVDLTPPTLQIQHCYSLNNSN